MGTDIHIIVQKCNDEGHWEDIGGTDYDGRSYRLFGWLAGVRNYSRVGPLVEPRGLPEGYENKGCLGDHHFTWYTLAELLAVDYNQIVEDRRVIVQYVNVIDGGCTTDSGDGEKMTLKEFLGNWWLIYLYGLARLTGDTPQNKVRLIMGFDS
jgi:hypothetical protein